MIHENHVSKIQKKEVSTLDNIENATLKKEARIINPEQRFGVHPKIKKSLDPDYVDYSFLKDNPHPVHCRGDGI